EFVDGADSRRRGGIRSGRRRLAPARCGRQHPRPDESADRGSRGGAVGAGCRNARGALVAGSERMNSANSTVSDLSRMHSPAARALAWLYAVTCVILAVYSATEAETRWPIGLAVIVCVAAVFGLVRVEGDPLPLWAAAAMMLTGAASSAAVLSVI